MSEPTSPITSKPGVKPGQKWFDPQKTSGGAYESFPIVSSVSPDSDRVSGGVAVTITGLRFVAGAAVTIGGIAATSVVVVSSTSITCNAPAVAEGIYDVVVINPDQQSGTLSLAFTFIAGHIVALSVSRGLTSGGTNVTITGVNFVTGSTIKFNGVLATGVIFVDATRFFCVTPASAAGVIDVTISEPGGAIVTGKKLFTFTSVVFDGDIRRNPSISIQQTLNSGPNAASFTLDGSGVSPVGGEKVIFTDRDTLLFNGQVTNVEQIFEGDDPTKLAWNVSALDDRFKFNRKRPFGTWDNVSASDIARELVTTYAPDFYPDFIQVRLPKISLVLTGEDDMVTVFTKITGLLNEGHWYVDNKTVHLFQLDSGLGSSDSPVSALVLPPITAMTVAASATSTLGYAWVPGWYYFLSSNYYGVPPTGDPNAKVYDALSATGVNVMATLANASGISLNYGQGGTPSLSNLQSSSPRWLLLSRQAANRNLLGDISNGSYCDHGKLFARGWIGVDVDGNVYAQGNWPAAGPNVLYFASSDVWSVLETASGPPSAPVQASFESGLSQISNCIYLEKFLPSFSAIPLGAVIGGRSCTSRNIYAVRLGDARGAGGTSIQGYATINDNTTAGPSTIAPSTNYQFNIPPHKNVNPPVAPVGSLTVQESATAVDATAFLGRVAHPGFWAFKMTGVYRDGTESRGCHASNTLQMLGTNQATLLQMPVFPSINGVDCVFRRIYGSVFFTASNPTLAGTPDFDVSDTACVYVVPDNVTDRLTFPFGSGVSGGEHSPNNTPPGEEDLPGPNLETPTDPDPLDAANTTMLLQPPLTSESDTTQLRNRVYVKGKGTVIASDAAIGDAVVRVADVSTFSPNGGTFMVGSRFIAYNGVDTTTTPQTLMLPSPLKTPILQADWKFGGGTPILPVVVVDDLASQKFYGALELDNDGQPTDGIHEFVISDDTLTNVQQLYARGLAELKLFSRPVVTIHYATRDPKTKAGKIIHVDLQNPPIYGDFIIQEVTIDQVHDENDDLNPRYTVTADSAARFNLNDLLLKLSGGVAEKASGSSAGVISTAVATTINTIQSTTSASPLIQSVSIVLTDAQVRAASTVAIPILSGQGASVVIYCVGWAASASVTIGFSANTVLNIRYSDGTASGVTGLNFGLTTIGLRNSFSAMNGGGQFNFTAPGLLNRSIEVFGNAAPTGGQTAAGVKFTLFYYIVTLP